MYKIAVCDDDNLNLEINKIMLKNYLEERKIMAEFELYSTPEALLDNSSNSHVFILDVVMPNVNGMEVGEKIKLKNPSAKIIYISGDRHYAADAYKLKADGYLVKPVWEKHFNEVLDDVFRELKEDSVFVKSDKKEIKLLCKNIKYVNCVDRFLVYHTDEEDIKTNCVRTTIEKTLGDLITHKSFYFMAPGLCVNLMRIKELGRDFIKFDDGEKIYFPKSKWKDLREKWIKI